MTRCATGCNRIGTTSTRSTGPPKPCSRRRPSAARHCGRNLARRLSDAHGVTVEDDPSLLEEGTVWRLHRGAKRLLLAQGASWASRVFWMAHILGQLECERLIDREVRRARLSTEEACSLARVGLANYFAGALMMPYGRFLEAAQATQHDIERLQSRFGASFEQVCHRLSTMQRPGLARHTVLFRQDRHRRQRAETEQRDALPVRPLRRSLPAVERVSRLREPRADSGSARHHAGRRHLRERCPHREPTRRFPSGAPAVRRRRPRMRGAICNADGVRSGPRSQQSRSRRSDRSRLPRLREKRMPPPRRSRRSAALWMWEAARGGHTLSHTRPAEWEGWEL